MDAAQAAASGLPDYGLQQRVAVEKDFAMFSRPITHGAFLKELEVGF